MGQAASKVLGTPYDNFQWNGVTGNRFIRGPLNAAQTRPRMDHQQIHIAVGGMGSPRSGPEEHHGIGIRPLYNALHTGVNFQEMSHWRHPPPCAGTPIRQDLSGSIIRLGRYRPNPHLGWHPATPPDVTRQEAVLACRQGRRRRFPELLGRVDSLPRCDAGVVHQT